MEVFELTTYNLCINGSQFKILLYAFKLAQLTSFERKNWFELSTQNEVSCLILTKEFLIGCHLCIGSMDSKLELIRYNIQLRASPWGWGKACQFDP